MIGASAPITGLWLERSTMHVLNIDIVYLAEEGKLFVRAIAGWGSAFDPRLWPRSVAAGALLLDMRGGWT
jgi:hypothetical protein